MFISAIQQCKSAIIIHTSPPFLAVLPSPHPIAPGHTYLQGRRCRCREWIGEHSRGGRGWDKWRGQHQNTHTHTHTHTIWCERVRQMERAASKHTHTHTHTHTLYGVREWDKWREQHQNTHTHTLSGVSWTAGEKLLQKQGAQTRTLWWSEVCFNFLKKQTI